MCIQEKEKLNIVILTKFTIYLPFHGATRHSLSFQASFCSQELSNSFWKPSSDPWLCPVAFTQSDWSITSPGEGGRIRKSERGNEPRALPRGASLSSSTKYDSISRLPVTQDLDI